LDAAALREMDYVRQQLASPSNVHSAGFWRRAYGRAVFSYLHAAACLLRADAMKAIGDASGPTRDDPSAVIDCLLDAVKLHVRAYATNMRHEPDELERVALNAAQDRLRRLTFPITIADMSITAAEVIAIEHAVNVLDTMLRGLPAQA
jgi:hypothetical protein